MSFMAKTGCSALQRENRWWNRWVCWQSCTPKFLPTQARALVFSFFFFLPFIHYSCFFFFFFYSVSSGLTNKTCPERSIPALPGVIAAASVFDVSLSRCGRVTASSTVRTRTRRRRRRSLFLLTASVSAASGGTLFILPCCANLLKHFFVFFIDIDLKPLYGFFNFFNKMNHWGRGLRCSVVSIKDGVPVSQRSRLSGKLWFSLRFQRKTRWVFI